MMNTVGLASNSPDMKNDRIRSVDKVLVIYCIVFGIFVNYF
ncbi:MULTISPECIES: hypothetical protein [unclassified Chryseobacterium]|nr:MULTISPECIES: hypothetical protein [unclassified Chryseobacterium]MDQ1859110.1 hypothetical protein [Chryseobacterium sp. WLY505]